MAERLMETKRGMLADDTQVGDKANDLANGARNSLRILRFSLVRLATLAFTVTAGVYLTILIANMGGYVDDIRRGEIREKVMTQLLENRALLMMSEDARAQWIADQIRLKENSLGLDRPFILRSVSFLTNAMSLNLGRATMMTSDSGSRTVRLILLERLAPTLLLFATENFLMFFISIFTALYLSRRYGSFLDKLIISLAPTSSAPGWFYGIFLVLIFASVLQILPFGGMVDAPPPEEPVTYALSVARHMILPVISLVIGTVFLATYTYRTFFLIYSTEDYVEMAKAKGLRSSEIERRYILQPTLPAIITNFSLAMIGMWTGAPILETVFNWPGLGRTLFQAIGLFETPVIVGETVIYSYLLAVTVFVLDFVYAMVDPRVRVGSEAKKA